MTGNAPERGWAGAVRREAVVRGGRQSRCLPAAVNFQTNTANTDLRGASLPPSAPTCLFLPLTVCCPHTPRPETQQADSAHLGPGA